MGHTLEAQLFFRGRGLDLCSCRKRNLESTQIWLKMVAFKVER